ncbi:hypothetical protein ElyMa_004034500 [Elysia marginata]|uniref:Uncharacterized protein n=1 Tax=Elysia marginata TaxID=1093978 RepID=A0AAV4G2N2_9GAST|nr:hypothetical protein ElyMa_004034500 [Elysia marginata]
MKASFSINGWLLFYPDRNIENAHFRDASPNNFQVSVAMFWAPVLIPHHRTHLATRGDNERMSVIPPCHNKIPICNDVPITTPRWRNLASYRPFLS